MLQNLQLNLSLHPILVVIQNSHRISHLMDISIIQRKLHPIILQQNLSTQTIHQILHVRYYLRHLVLVVRTLRILLQIIIIIRLLLSILRIVLENYLKLQLHFFTAPLLLLFKILLIVPVYSALKVLKLLNKNLILLLLFLLLL